jgi:ParB family transcriptional regulator, chromosome partitioning protein
MSAIGRRSLQVDDPLGPDTGPAQDQGSSSATHAGGAAAGRLRDIPLEQIRANPDQPRKKFDEVSLVSLAESIRERGVLQPIIVRPVEQGYEVVAGERRWRAAQVAGEATIPALIDDAVDEAGSLELALIENVVREDLTPIEQARTLATLLDDLRLTASVLATRLGRSRADIANTVRLLELPDEAIELIDSGMLSKGHGKVLLAEPDHDRRRFLARRSVAYGWSVRTLEAEIARGGKSKTPAHTPHPDQSAAAARLEEAIAKATGCEARAKPHRQGFRVVLDYAAAEQLMRVLAGDAAGL